MDFHFFDLYIWHLVCNLYLSTWPLQIQQYTTVWAWPWNQSIRIGFPYYSPVWDLEKSWTSKMISFLGGPLILEMKELWQLFFRDNPQWVSFAVFTSCVVPMNLDRSVTCFDQQNKPAVTLWFLKLFHSKALKLSPGPLRMLLLGKASHLLRRPKAWDCHVESSAS